MITRQNYEEFFLLYIDQELSAADRQMVESFVADHPDLRAELDVLVKCRLEPARDAFPDKAALLRPAMTEETLLLYIDGELDAEARSVVETRAQEDPALHRELELLRQTMSEPDTTVLFSRKETLYKRERERGIFFMPMFRIAAAVMLMVLAGLAVLFLTKKKESPVIALAPGKKIENMALRPGKNSSTTVTRNTSRALYPSMASQQQPEEIRDRRAGRIEVALTVAQIETDRSGHPLPVPGVGVGTIAVSGTSAGAVAGADAGALGGAGTTTGGDAGAGTIKRGTFATDALQKEGSDVADNSAVANRGDAADDGDAANRGDAADSGNETDKGVDADATPSRKKRLRGVFRTVSRVFERTTGQTDEDRHGILIGNLQIALK